MEYVELTNANHMDSHVVNELDDDSQQVAEAMVQLGTMGYYPPENVEGGVEGDGMDAFKLHQLTAIHHDQGMLSAIVYKDKLRLFSFFIYLQVRIFSFSRRRFGFRPQLRPIRFPHIGQSPNCCPSSWRRLAFGLEGPRSFW